MADRFFGLLSTDVYGITAEEARCAHIQLSTAQAVAADTDGLLDGTALPAVATTVTEFLNDMPYVRNVTMVCSATQTGDAVVTGTNIADAVITETFTLTSDTPVVGALAFKTVTSIALPVRVGSETIDVGWGDKIGLPFMSATKPCVLAYLDKARETTEPTLVADADEIEKNTIDLNSNLNGKVVDIYLFLD